jgi:carbamoyltransferase
MGLAPYGQPKYVDKVMKIIKFLPNGLYTWDGNIFVPPTKAGFEYVDNMPSVGNLFSEYFEKQFGQARRKNEELTQYHKDLASSVQKATEEIIFHVLRELKKKNGFKKYLYRRWCAQNSVANGKLAEATGFEGVYIPSAGHDAEYQWAQHYITITRN